MSQSRQSIREVTLVTFDEQRDRARLEEWLHRAHVTRWWSDPDFALSECLDRPEGGDHAMIYADSVPVGYLCSQRPARSEFDAAGLFEIPDGAVDIDILIGELEYVGRGIGPRALAILLDRLLADPTVPLVELCTSVQNTAAIRAFEKAGFRRLREFDDPVHGRCLMFAAQPAPTRQ